MMPLSPKTEASFPIPLSRIPAPKKIKLINLKRPWLFYRDECLKRCGEIQGKAKMEQIRSTFRIWDIDRSALNGKQRKGRTSKAFLLIYTDTNIPFQDLNPSDKNAREEKCLKPVSVLETFQGSLYQLAVKPRLFSCPVDTQQEKNPLFRRRSNPGRRRKETRKRKRPPPSSFETLLVLPPFAGSHQTFSPTLPSFRPPHTWAQTVLKRIMTCSS